MPVYKPKVTPFPETGSIKGIKPWCDVARLVCAGKDPDKIAAEFRTEMMKLDRSIKNDQTLRYFYRFCRLKGPILCELPPKERVNAR